MLRKLTVCALFSLPLLILGRVAADEPPLVHEAVLNAPVRAVWEAYTTKAGQEAWNVAHAEVDLRLGGTLRTHYDPKGKLGDPNTIEATILALDPERMLASKITATPEKFPFKAAAARTWTVLYFEPQGENRTRLTVKMLGFGSDEESKKMRAFFDKGNAYTLQKLKEYVEKKPGA